MDKPRGVLTRLLPGVATSAPHPVGTDVKPRRVPAGEPPAPPACLPAPTQVPVSKIRHMPAARVEEGALAHRGGG